MVESNNIEQVKEIIAFLKRQNENKDYSSVELNNFVDSTQCPVSQQYCDKGQHYTKEAVSKSNEDIKSIIKELKAKKEQTINETGKSICNFIFIQHDEPDNINFTSTSTKNVDESILKDNVGSVKKICTNYSQKPNNKRFKLNHCSNDKQLHLTEFFNVVKSVQHDDKSSSENYKSLVSNCASIANKAKNRTGNIQLAKNSILSKHYYSISEKDHRQNLKKLCSSQSKVAIENLRQTNADIQGKDRLKDLVSKNTSQRTVEDFCKNIINCNSNKVTVSKLTPSKEPFCKGNIFLKSFSTGTIIPEKEIHKDINSVPVTGDEISDVKKQLEGTTTFDDFVKGILKKIKNDANNGNITEDKENDFKENISNRLEESSNKDMITSVSSQQNDFNRKLQTSQNIGQSYNSEFLGTDTALETYINSLSTANFLQPKGDADQQNDLRDKLIPSLLRTNANDDSKVCYSQGSQKCPDSERSSSITYRMQDKNSANENGEYIDDLYKCISSSCTQNEINFENSSETQVDNSKGMETTEEKTSTINNREMKTTEDSNEQTSGSFKLEDFLKNIIPTIEKKALKNNTPDKCKFHVKRYKKGKTKIYKLQKMKKRKTTEETEEVDTDLNFHDVLLKMTTGNGESQPRLSRFKSGSSISTSSSYVTDDTRSEILSTGSKELTSPQQRLRTGFNELSKDKSLRYSTNEWEDVPEYDKEHIKMKIQDIFCQILEDFNNNRTSYLRHRRQSFDNCVFKDGRIQLKPVVESSMTVISSGAKRSKAKFELMLYILKKVQTLLETDTKLTKRSLYYQIKELISDQRVTDRAINAISCLLDVGMWALNIIAQKGLVFGDMKLLLSSGEMLNCNIPGTLIPQDINDIVEIHSTAYFILVVEKEAIFHKLIEEDLPNKLTRPFIMITGKGFPDLNTQLFLKKLWMVMSIPVFILVDADPHGINIMLNYRFGSMDVILRWKRKASICSMHLIDCIQETAALCQAGGLNGHFLYTVLQHFVKTNNAHVSQHLAVPNAKWLGVYPSEIINLNIARQPLNEKELKLVGHMLRTPYMEFSPKLVNELEYLLTKKLKASIEGLIKTDSYLSEVYLPNKFFTHNFI